MKALIFAAGIGQRMRPLTNHTPKPLLCAGGEPLIVWNLRKLAALGISEVVINTAWLGEQFPEILGDGQRFGLRLFYSNEGSLPLETGGGMLHALPLLGNAPFLAINGDIWTDADLTRLPTEPVGDAHLMLVNNPEYHPQGDFVLQPDSSVLDRTPGIPTLTFAGLGIYRSQLLADWRNIIGDTPDTHAQPPRFKLAPLLRATMRRGRIHGTHHRGQWTDVGTPQRLHALDTWLRSPAARF
ncbi:nucleotidyltransferase family protein [Xylella fastidiosa]|uniref:Nucleotidyltransferase family protein n=2 Tax=Xylella fastidiosa TaxID=2371 RepID=A0ABC8AC28_XYLFS|nr:nucleotidyltransferase family protein [Xylella fastidiosa]AAF83401.1 virulence factor [Xylella fastidiosa 9a5c]ALQ94204.1 mannose-1-phosphate guanylyltransferase [Xylella fastidiosa]ALQ96400.1 nucleotidyltransferase family protein [Xylella fastidiosa]ALR01290.1 mannose-1-phosphate guanylyltransferase [Xylella fastidiosa]ALR03669.1 nucleotidyltransferase family protein [Xylella fastidiosa]